MTTRERLADYAHEAWAGWMVYLFSRSVKNADGSITIPPELVARWERQTVTPYADLPENEQASDLAEADRMLAIAAPKPPTRYAWEGEGDEQPQPAAARGGRGAR